MPYASLADVPDNLREHQGAALTLAQVNWVAAIADALAAREDIDEPWAVAWARFTDAHTRRGKSWVKKSGTSEAMVMAPDEVGPEDRKPYQQTARITEVLPLVDVQPTAAADEFRVEFLAAGTTKGGERHYPIRTTEAAAVSGVFDGARMYINHSSPADDQRGHRDVRELAGVLKRGSVHVHEGNLRGVAKVVDPTIQRILADPDTRASIGLSHDSRITYYPRRIDGREVAVVESIDECYSVDWVPDGNAYGRVLEATARNTAKEREDMDPKDLTVDTLAEARPDLVQSIEERAREAAKADAAKAVEAAKTQAVEEYKQAQAAEAAAKDKPNADAATPADVQALVDAAVAEATKPLRDDIAKRQVRDIVEAQVAQAEGITEATRARIVEQFADQIIPAAEIVQRVKEAVERAKEYELDLLAELGVGTAVQGAGETDATQTKAVREAHDAKARAALKDAGMSQAEIDALMAAR